MTDHAEHYEKDIQYHAATAHEYDAVVVEPRELANEILFADIDHAVPRGGRMLDIGCGTGHGLMRFGDRFDAVIGIDHSPAMLALAAAKLKAGGRVNTFLVRQNVFEFIESAVTPFDFVTAIGCFHHLLPETLPGLVRSIANAMASGGRLLVADPIRVDLSKQPAEIAQWNAKSVAVGLDFDSDAEEADEAPLDYGLLMDAFTSAGLMPFAETRGWELFPHSLPPGDEDRREIECLHRAHGESGNVLCTVFRKP